MNTEVQTGADKPQTGPDVAVTINGTSKNIHRGSWKISALKTELGVAGFPNFEQVLDSGFKPWTDDERITIKGGESFVTHGGGGGSARD